MTHSLGAGTVNFSVPLTSEERKQWGRAAFDADAKSTSDFFRQMALNGLRAFNASAAQTIQELRTNRRARKAGVLTLIAFAVVLSNDDSMIRHRASRSRRRDEIELSSQTA